MFTNLATSKRTALRFTKGWILKHSCRYEKFEFVCLKLATVLQNTLERNEFSLIILFKKKKTGRRNGITEGKKNSRRNSKPRFREYEQRQVSTVGDQNTLLLQWNTLGIAPVLIFCVSCCMFPLFGQFNFAHIEKSSHDYLNMLGNFMYPQLQVLQHAILFKKDGVTSLWSSNVPLQN